MAEKKFRFYIAGLKFHQYDKVADLIQEEDHCTLEKEPENQYDPFAVRIYYTEDALGTFLLGHVPMKMKQSLQISQALADGLDYVCEVVKHVPEAPPYERVKVEVTFNG